MVLSLGRAERRGRGGFAEDTERSVSLANPRRPLRSSLVCAALLLVTVAAAGAQQDVRSLAARVDAHYNHLHSLRASFAERYSGMGQQRTEQGTLLLQKPGRMRWHYAGGKLFVLDGKSAISYVPGDPQAQRIPARQLDDARSPLRFLLGHTQLEKELDHLQARPEPDGTVTLSGVPRYATGPETARVQSIAVRVESATGAIRGLELREIDGTVTRFEFSGMEENVPVRAEDFRFTPPPGVTVVDGLPPN